MKIGNVNFNGSKSIEEDSTGNSKIRIRRIYVMRDEKGQISLTLMWIGIVLLGVIAYWNTKWDFQFSPTGLLLTGADVLRVEPKATAIVQPIAFPHSTHMKKAGVPCDYCHTTVRTEDFASLPGVDICLGCHSTKLTDNPEEEKIRQFARNRQEIPWIQLNRLPPHVYFSHETHVTGRRLLCVNCMGPMEELQKPPPKPLKKLRMEFCLNCHRKVGATQNCASCHK